MKNLMISMLAVVAMVSCTKENDPINPEIPTTGNDKVEIKLTAGVGEVTTKAPVNSTFTEDLNVLFFKPADAATTDWRTGDHIRATMASAAGHAITFKDTDGATKPLYYNADGAKKSFLAGYYLGGVTATGLANVLTFTINGTQDIMATKGQEGQKAFAFPAFEFKHLLSQLEIVVTPSDGADLDAINTLFGKVEKIEVLDQDSKFDLTLAGEPALAVNTTESVAKTSFKLEPVEGFTIAQNALMGQLMILPPTSNVIKLSVKTANVPMAFPVDVTIAGGLTASSKYRITLKFSSSAITGTGSVGEWTDGTNGSGEVK